MSLKRYFKKLSNENKGFIFGFIGIIIFSITPTATKIALGSNNNELSPEFITFGRSAVAGILSFTYLFLSKRRIPKLKYLFDFSVIALCITVVFPLSLSLVKSGFGFDFNCSIFNIFKITII